MSEPTGAVFNIMRYSTEDGPGIRTTVFLKGCPLSCQWCHNPESQRREPELMFRPKFCIGCGACVEVCHQGAARMTSDGPAQVYDICRNCGTCATVCSTGAREMVGREMSVSQVMTEVLKDLPFYEESGGGVTFGGGEPFYQPEFLLAMLRACKAEELHTVVDTCGVVAEAELRAVLPYVDLFLYDLKQLDEVRHLALVGSSNQLILSNLRLLDSLKAPTVVRVPFIPGANDDGQNLDRLGTLLKSLANINQLELLPYHHSGAEKYRVLGRGREVREIRPPSVASLARARELLSSYGVTVTVKGQES